MSKKAYARHTPLKIVMLYSGIVIGSNPASLLSWKPLTDTSH